MQYLSVKDVSLKWGYSEATIRTWCRKGLINITVGAEKRNGHWQIPSNAQCPKKLKI